MALIKQIDFHCHFKAMVRAPSLTVDKNSQQSEFFKSPTALSFEFFASSPTLLS